MGHHRPVPTDPTPARELGPDPAARSAGYARAHLRVDLAGPRLVLVPRPAGTTLGTFPFARPVHVVTAADPGPARLTPAENAARHEALLVDPALHDRRRYDTVTSAADGTHAEYGVLLEGLDDDGARALGVRFGQDAVFRWSRDAWSVLPCGPGEPTVLGWETRTSEAGDTGARAGEAP